jgi:hypothetical protein
MVLSYGGVFFGLNDGEWIGRMENRETKVRSLRGKKFPIKTLESDAIQLF